jgi:lipopolysaccharide export LptBFGC system permease protein LptF
MFAVLLSFSRLSADGEYTAMLAVGFSFKKAVLPVLALSAILYAVGVYCAMNLEPWGRRETVEFRHRKTQTALDNIIKVKLKSGVFLDDFLGYVLYAEQISEDKTELQSVLMAPRTNKSEPNAGRFLITASSASITGSVEKGNLTMAFNNGTYSSINPKREDVSVVKFKKAELDLLKIFQEQIFGPDIAQDDYRSYSPLQLWKYIDTIKADPNPEVKNTYLKARFLLHQRIGLPFLSVVFGLFATVLAIHDERKGKNFGYIGTIITIILGYVFLMGCKWLAEKGVVSAPFGVWFPNILMLAIGLFLVYQRSRLPPSESPLDPKFIPGIRRLLRRNPLQAGHVHRF